MILLIVKIAQLWCNRNISPQGMIFEALELRV
jgi:hypothetical protein